jgi:uncharacterized protein (TIGR02145 family)
MGWGLNKYKLTRFTVKKVCHVYYLRWWYNGWHYWAFKPGQQSINTEGEKYRTVGSKSVLMGTGQITYEQCEAIRTILNTREVYILTSDGWKNITITTGSVVVYDNQINGYEIELSAKIGSKEISITGFSPIIPDVPIYPPDVIVIVTIIEAVFTITFTGTCPITIDWGDGSAPEVFILTAAETTVTHDYTGSGGGEKMIVIDGEECIKTIEAPNDEIVVIIIPPTATELEELIIPGNLLPEIPVIPPTVPLVVLDITNNPLAICQVQIGTQVWMCKNYGSDFPGSKVYNNDEANRAIYGGLYTFNQAITEGFCPYGYHVPTDTEWQELIDYVGGDAIAGGKLKAIGTTYWNAPNTGADNSFGFDARGTGYGYLSSGEMVYVENKVNGYFLTKSIGSLGAPYIAAVNMSNYMADAYIVNLPPYIFFGVRLIRNWAGVITPATFNDYFLPSKNELNEMFVELDSHSVGGFATAYYWSSSETLGGDSAWFQAFGSGGGQGGQYKTFAFHVRACRAFTSAVPYSLRDVGPAGGLIFWNSGSDYLEAAPSDQSSSQIWSNISTDIGVAAQGIAIGTGQANTTAIVSQVGHTSSAAKLCNDLIV